jgi:hypothetical protein
MEEFSTETYTLKKESEGGLLLTLIHCTTLDIFVSNTIQIRYKICEHNFKTDMHELNIY